MTIRLVIVYLGFYYHILILRQRNFRFVRHHHKISVFQR